MNYQFQPKGICASRMEVELDGVIISSVKISGGCDGNHKGLISLLIGMDANDAIERLRGITCGPRNTSCPDQLAICLEQALAKAN